jgi:hypothetical protein
VDALIDALRRLPDSAPPRGAMPLAGDGAPVRPRRRTGKRAVRYAADLLPDAAAALDAALGFPSSSSLGTRA